MSRYVYKGWLRNAEDDPGESHDQWWIAMIIEAATPAQAEDWGDRLTKEYCARFKQNRFVTSEVTWAAKEPLASLDFPVLRYGERPADFHMGW